MVIDIGGAAQNFIWVPPGRFITRFLQEDSLFKYKDPEEALITEGYWLADTACTQILWYTLLRHNPSFNKENPDNPVENVGENHIEGFLRKFSHRIRELNLLASLPNSLEWEYACRAGTATDFYFGDNFDSSLINASGLFKTIPVASLPPNPWGFYEMHGNIWEQCKGSNAEKDTRGPTIIRGGGYNSYPYDCKSYIMYRHRGDPSSSVGFRIKLSAPSYLYEE